MDGWIIVGPFLPLQIRLYDYPFLLQYASGAWQKPTDGHWFQPCVCVGRSLLMRWMARMEKVRINQRKKEMEWPGWRLFIRKRVLWRMYSSKNNPEIRLHWKRVINTVRESERWGWRFIMAVMKLSVTSGTYMKLFVGFYESPCRLQSYCCQQLSESDIWVMAIWLIPQHCESCVLQIPFIYGAFWLSSVYVQSR